MDCTITGLIAEENRRSTLLWRSDYKPEIVAYDAGPGIISGSGQKSLFDLLNRSRQTMTEGETTESSGHHMGALFCASLMAHEMINPQTLWSWSGGAFEAIYFDGSKFCRVDEYVVIMWECVGPIRSSDIRLAVPPIRLGYWNDYLVIKRFTFESANPQVAESNSPLVCAPHYYLVSPLRHEHPVVDSKRVIKAIAKRHRKKKPSTIVHVVAVRGKDVSPSAEDDDVFLHLYAEDPRHPLSSYLETASGLQLSFSPDFAGQLRDGLEQSTNANTL
ncbi:MAG: hypothetical protein RIC24_00015 [Hyphomicrobiales bacterium]|jgi:hypothetical protein